MKRYILAFVLCFSIGASAETYNFARLDNTNGLSNNQIECIYKDSRGFMWFGTNYGLNRYDGHNVKVYKSKKNDSTSLMYNAITRIQEDEKGNLWLAANPSYVVYDVLTEKFNRDVSFFLSPLGIHFIPSLVEIDKEKNYYFYHTNDGIYKYEISTKKLFHYRQSTDANTFSKGQIIDMKSEHGFLWVLFQSGLLERLNEKTNTIDFRNYYVQKKQLGATIQKKLFIDSSGSPWVY
ncbi:MAG: two-component regulator propeller domain-containing protein, partial [Paludibacter sp.]|nr:two-component regulator propeller domain-containing protein [Paludibacter sp.]